MTTDLKPDHTLTAHVDEWLKDIYTKGAKITAIAMGREDLCRLMGSSDMALLKKLRGYIHPITGECIPILFEPERLPGCIRFQVVTTPA